MEKKETMILGTEPSDIRAAAAIIRDGGLVAFPTETVYGLGADGMNGEAAAKIYEAKGRPSDNPMIVHISSKNDLKKLTDHITQDMKTLMDAFWPGPLTMVVPALPSVPRVTTGGLSTVAVRMPNHPVALALIEASGVPIAAPSANASGRPSPTTGMHVLDDLNGRIDAVIMGEPCRIGIESTVVDMTQDPPMILRPGKLTAEDLSRKLGKKVTLDPALLVRPDIHRIGDSLMETDTEFHPKSPGMKYKHYAPKAEMIIFEGEAEKVRLAIAEAKLERAERGEKVGIILYDDSRPEEAAHDFFAQLRAFDKSGVDVIFAAALKEDGVGFAVMNRMFKSAGYHTIQV
ncbi:MAG: L-threonylcarbamoyladenylate synthase [Anaerovoracaceae bacterium]|nr:L-threonylcarbamoyladenylate synthase [Anaerovoracaceae bacterium]